MPTLRQPSPLLDLGRRCLDDLEELTGRFLTEIRAIPPYDSETVPWDLVRRDATDSFDLLLRLVAGLPVPERLQPTSENIGRDRARRGVPLEALQQAVRLDMQVVWAQLLRRAEDHERDLLLASAFRVWEAVEQHILRIQAGYLEEEAVIASEHEQHRGQLLRRLVDTGGRDPRVCGQIRTALRARPDGAWVVARCRVEDDMALRAEAARLQLLGTAAHAQDVGGWPLLLAQLPADVADLPATWLGRLACGVVVVPDLAAVPRGAELTRAVAAVLPPDAARPHSVRDVWAHLVVDRLGDVRGQLVREVLGGLERTTPAERERLVATVEAYARTGSVAATAAALYCHRNTVLNRLSRLRELVGYDVTAPAQAAPVLLALHCLDQSGRA